MMNNDPLISPQALPFNELWYLLPLFIAICLVFGATRHENWSGILFQALQNARWIALFVLVVFGILYAVSWAV